ncbi:MAG: bifunctional phosphopantothenoylcysteine decarboxylase/phosphopantothenate--cysteine ligase CoaBC [Coriobacteriaceae bacterium]|jgi:phosphopantothenoylcysteine decarboxylase/phosphopantothenate--cysteine ligase|nr:bifunctional phosphopantothenoylcysteine decarboxylase/phosphopantothenate--cysteine ligase CoaBC [Coriobacteriaceae bacterium]
MIKDAFLSDPRKSGLDAEHPVSDEAVLQTSPHTPATVLLGVTGCVAAYKSAEVVRGLQKAGIRVKVVMTAHAQEFVGAATFRALTREPVAVGLFDAPGAPLHHISLAQEADLFLIAPCTANVMAKLAAGIADDILTTTALATEAPLLIAPAMNVRMYEAPATRENRERLIGRGVRFIDAEVGYLACGDVGKGRLADVDAIVDAALEALGHRRDLKGLRVLVTAGPTVEAIDPVRCITNHSSGKMGYALAEAALARGAQVDLVSGPVALCAPAGASLHQAQSAQDMLEAARRCFPGVDIALFAAAVCDMRPKEAASKKLKKGNDDERLSLLEFVANPDILATLAAEKSPGQMVVGFAAETDEVATNAQKKLAAKGADLIVANRVGEGLVFGEDCNTALLVDAEGASALPTMRKRALADVILDKAVGMLEDRKAR